MKILYVQNVKFDVFYIKKWNIFGPFVGEYEIVYFFGEKVFFEENFYSIPEVMFRSIGSLPYRKREFKDSNHGIEYYNI